jgi:L-amino acid N-acyltransferase YncA
MTVRAIERADLPGLRALYEGLSLEDRRHRFFSLFWPDDDFLERVVTAPERGAFAVVAVLDDGSLVGEASYEPLGDDCAELAITVAAEWHGWLGHYLLDALVAAAAERGITSLEAEILLDNRAMLALVRARGYVTLGHDDFTTLRVAIGTVACMPLWPSGARHPRVLVEARGGRWRAEACARANGLQLAVCPGPHPGSGRPACPVLRGEACPVAAGADAIVCALDADDPDIDVILEGHHRYHAGRPLHLDDGTTGKEELVRTLKAGGRS